MIRIACSSYGRLHLTRRVPLIASALLLALSSPSIQAQGMRRSTIRGRVTVDSGRPVIGAEVVVVMAPDRAIERTITDSAGRYEVVFDHASGDYLIHADAPGTVAFRKRVTTASSDSILVFDVHLTRVVAQQLSVIRVTTRRPKPRRGGDFGVAAGTGGAEQVAAAVIGALRPDQSGDLGAIAATVPGVLVTSSGASAAGVSSSQNSVTLGGIGFPGDVIPRDALTTVRVTKSTYDPARGWFGGLQENVELSSGVVGSLKHVHFTVDAPELQYTDPVSARLGHKFTGFQAGAGGQDHFHYNRLEYNYGAQAGRRLSNVVSLGTAPTAVLAKFGLIPDSVNSLLSALRTAGVPVALRSASQVTENASFIGQIGAAPEDWLTFQPVKTVWQLVGYGKLLSTTAVGASPTSLFGYSATSTQQQLALQAHLSTFIHGDYLTDARSGLSLSHSYATPNSRLPAGRVLLAAEPSGVQNNASSITPITFGGYDALPGDLTQGTWETHASMDFFPRMHSAHHLTLTSDSRFDWVRQSTDVASPGAFTFLTASDVAANRPASFTRTFAVPAGTGKEWNSFIALGDLWRKSDSFQLLYGARLEANRFVGRPAYNPEIASLFGVRTDHLPNTVGVSPRIGFTWIRRGNRGGYATTPLGDFIRIPTGYVRGGIGEFRGLLSPLLASGVSTLAGLPAGAQSLTCIGPATPTPEWGSYIANPASVPEQCANTYIPSTFSDLAPNVQLIDKAYTAPRSWRANVVYGSSLGQLTYSVEALASLNLDQPGRVDLNFTGVPVFRTSDENRPIFVAPSSIVANTGLVATPTARLSPSFGHVFDNVSRLSSFSRQATITIAPDLDGIKWWFGSLSYTLSNTRALQSGFDGSTFDSPVNQTWARGDLDVRHQILVQSGITKRGIAFTLFGRLQSGFPFTPIIGSDVNGDGLANDRAFIFDPSRSPDTSVATATRALLGSAGSIRNCLLHQLGRTAGRNSCEGPWSASLNAQVTYSGKLPLMNHNGTIALAFVNPLGGLDQLLHGTAQHGWGTPALPDPVLYTVRAFDPSTNRFLYAVNSRFASTQSQAALLRTPFRITLDIRVDLSAPSERQFLDRWVRPGRNGFPGQRVQAAAIRRSYARTAPDAYDVILAESDSLMLSTKQQEALQNAARDYQTKRDAILDSLATYLAGLGDRYSEADALRRQHEALDSIWELGHVELKRTLPAILSRMQLRMLPFPAGLLYATPDDVKGLKILSANQ